MGWRCLGLSGMTFVASIVVACGGEIANPADGAGASALDPAERTRPPSPPAEAGADPESPSGTVGACASIPPALCDFDGTCPPIAAIIMAGAKGEYAPGAGPDGSTAYRVRAAASGVGAGFGMPFFDFHAHPGIALASTDACQVVCEATMRVVQATPGTVIFGGEPTEAGAWSVTTAAGGYDHRSPGASAAHAVASSSDWFRIRVRLTPKGPSSTSEVTILAADGTSTTTTVPSQRQAHNVSLGLFQATGRGELYFDDVSCRVTDPR